MIIFFFTKFLSCTSVYSIHEINASIYLCLRNATNSTIHSFPLNFCSVRFTLTVTVDCVFQYSVCSMYEMPVHPFCSVFSFRCACLFFSFNSMLILLLYFPFFLLSFLAFHSASVPLSYTLTHSILHSTENETLSETTRHTQHATPL